MAKNKKDKNVESEVDYQDAVIPSGAGRGLIAKRDFKIVHNQYDIVIKAGQDLSDIPPQFIENLITEKVIE